ncbi:MAG: peptidoglycan DD-metalloendopeptidase family protein [Chitinophagaceae bacterium]|nr:peptidoglycan DD-metalloendopeptidase family protein [Chitinophagaceae bacterium]
MIRKIAVQLLFSFFLFSVAAQPITDKTQLEKERQDIQRELKEIQGLYNKVKGQTKLTIGQLAVLNRKINLQEQYIGSISKELRTIDDDIYLSELEIYRLNKQIDTLKTQYARTVVYAYKNKSNYDYLNFIFSASGFNDAIKRIAYLKSYRTYREKQVNIILETQQLIAKRKEQQLGRKQSKNVALENQTKQVEELAVQKRVKAEVVSQLKSKEKDLSNQIAQKKKRDRDLNNAIVAIVKRDIKAAEDKAKAEAEAKRKANEIANKTNAVTTTATKPDNPEKKVTTIAEPKVVKKTVPEVKPDSYLNLNAKDVALNSSFQANRALLPWPVDNGVVTFGFGTNRIDNLSFDNPGITIATPSQGVTVKAVFEGEVRGIYNLGDGMAVTIRHGKYFTTYSNLSGVTVSKGDIVKTGQQIGRAGSNEAGNAGQIDFILMVETKNVDPRPWLRR